VYTACQSCACIVSLRRLLVTYLHYLTCFIVIKITIMTLLLLFVLLVVMVVIVAMAT